jgi:transcription antitermination factor NusG
MEIGKENDEALNWYALFTRHQHEKLVASSLSSKDFEIYLPLYCSVRRWQDRVKQLSLPLFPGYVFVREGMDRQLQLLTTPGVIHIVGWGGCPAIVPQAQLDAVRQMMESNLAIEANCYLECGDRVRVRAGPLAGLQGIFIRKKGLARLVVSVQMLGRSASVEIDICNVERIGLLHAASGHACAGKGEVSPFPAPHPLEVS